MADINEYDIQYLQFLEKIGMTPPQLRHQQLTGQHQNNSCSKRKLFQNTTDDMEIQMEPTYQRINQILVLTEKNTQEINQIVYKNSAILQNLEGKSPTQEQNTSLIPPLETRLGKDNDEFFDENNQDNSNRTNLCYYSKNNDGKKFPTYKNSMKNQDEQKPMELEETQHQQLIPEETQQNNIQQQEEIIEEEQINQENELDEKKNFEIAESFQCKNVQENLSQEPQIPEEQQIPQEPDNNINLKEYKEINQERAIIEQICQELIISQQKVMLEIENIIQKSRASSESSSIISENQEEKTVNKVEEILVGEPVIGKNNAFILSTNYQTVDQKHNEIAKAEEQKIIEIKKKVKTEKQIEKRKQSRKINKKKRKERKQQEKNQQQRKNLEQQPLEQNIQQENNQKQNSQKDQQIIAEEQVIPNPVSNLLMNFLNKVQQVPIKKVIKNWAQCSYLQNRFYRKRIILKLSCENSKSFNK